MSVVATWYFISPSPPSLYNRMCGAVLGKKMIVTNGMLELVVVD